MAGQVGRSRDGGHAVGLVSWPLLGEGARLCVVRTRWYVLGCGAGAGGADLCGQCCSWGLRGRPGVPLRVRAEGGGQEAAGGSGCVYHCHRFV